MRNFKFLIIFLSFILLLSISCKNVNAVTQLVTVFWTQGFVDPAVPDVNYWRIFVSYDGGANWTYCRQVPWPGAPQSEYFDTCPVNFDLLVVPKLEFRVDCVRTNGVVAPSNEVKKKCDINVGPKPDIKAIICP